MSAVAVGIVATVGMTTLETQAMSGVDLRERNPREEIRGQRMTVLAKVAVLAKERKEIAVRKKWSKKNRKGAISAEGYRSPLWKRRRHRLKEVR